MNNETQFKSRLKREAIQFLVYFLFFGFFFCALSTYTRLVLGEYAINFNDYGYAIVESLILAKILLIGERLGIGERFKEPPLIIPTLYKTLVFALFAFVFTVVEHFIIGSLEGHSLQKIYHSLIDHGKDVIFAKIVVIGLVFFCFFAFLEIGQWIGEERLIELFFKKKKGS